VPWYENSVAVWLGTVLGDEPGARLRFMLGLVDDRDAEVRSGPRFALGDLSRRRRSVTSRVAAAMGERLFKEGPADRRETAELLSWFGAAANAEAEPLAQASTTPTRRCAPSRW
jgi:hypothetical protein